MRISTSQIYNNLLTGIQNQMEIQNRANTQVSSGTRFQTPAEAGLDYKLSLDIRHAQTSTQGSIDAITSAESRLGVSQMALADMESVMLRSESLAVQQTNAGLTAQDRAAAAIEVGHLIDRFMENANKTWNGQSLFSGTAVDKPAFINNTFSAGTTAYTPGANTSITAITQTLNPNAVNDTYAITLDATGTNISSITGTAGTNLLAAPVPLATGANAVSMNNGVELSISYNGIPDTVNQAAGSLAVSGAIQQGTITYNGSNDDRIITVTSTQQVASNIRGDNPGFLNAINALQNFQTALQANDTAAIQTSLGELTTAGDGVVNLTSEVGARLNYLQSYRTSFEDMKIHLDRQLNTHEAVDLAAVVTELEQSNITLQASYSQIAKLGSLSLVNYL